MKTHATDIDYAAMGCDPTDHEPTPDPLDVAIAELTAERNALRETCAELLAALVGEHGDRVGFFEAFMFEAEKQLVKPDDVDWDAWHMHFAEIYQFIVDARAAIAKAKRRAVWATTFTGGED